MGLAPGADLPPGEATALQVRPIEDDDALRASFALIVQLRPQLDVDGYLAAVRQQRQEGYRLAGLFDGRRCVALAGYRLQHMLAHGRLLYVDDLVTDSRLQGCGLGKRLFDWLVMEARREGCAFLQLDSGTQRHGAHAFYFGRGMHVSSFHFSVKLES